MYEIPTPDFGPSDSQVSEQGTVSKFTLDISSKVDDTQATATASIARPRPAGQQKGGGNYVPWHMIQKRLPTLQTSSPATTTTSSPISCPLSPAMSAGIPVVHRPVSQQAMTSPMAVNLLDSTSSVSELCPSTLPPIRIKTEERTHTYHKQQAQLGSTSVLHIKSEDDWIVPGLPERVLFSDVQFSAVEQLALNRARSLLKISDTCVYDQTLLRLLARHQGHSMLRNVCSHFKANTLWFQNEMKAASELYEQLKKQQIVYSFGSTYWRHPVIVCRASSIRAVGHKTYLRVAAYLINLVSVRLLRPEFVSQIVLLFDMTTCTFHERSALRILLDLDNLFTGLLAGVFFVNCDEGFFQFVSQIERIPAHLLPKLHFVQPGSGYLQKHISPDCLEFCYGGLAQATSSTSEDVHCSALPPSPQQSVAVKMIGEFGPTIRPQTWPLNIPGDEWLQDNISLEQLRETLLRISSKDSFIHRICSERRVFSTDDLCPFERAMKAEFEKFTADFSRGSHNLLSDVEDSLVLRLLHSSCGDVEMSRTLLTRLQNWRQHQSPLAADLFHTFSENGLMYHFGCSRWGEPVLVLRGRVMGEMTSNDDAILYVSYLLDSVTSQLLTDGIVEQWVIITDLSGVANVQNLCEFLNTLECYYPRYTSRILIVNFDNQIKSDDSNDDLGFLGHLCISLRTVCRFVPVDGPVLNWICASQLETHFGGDAIPAVNFANLRVTRQTSQPIKPLVPIILRPLRGTATLLFTRTIRMIYESISLAPPSSSVGGELQQPTTFFQHSTGPLQLQPSRLISTVVTTIPARPSSNMADSWSSLRSDTSLLSPGRSHPVAPSPLVDQLQPSPLSKLTPIDTAALRDLGCDLSAVGYPVVDTNKDSTAGDSTPAPPQHRSDCVSPQSIPPYVGSPTAMAFQSEMLPSPQHHPTPAASSQEFNFCNDSTPAPAPSTMSASAIDSVDEGSTDDWSLAADDLSGCQQATCSRDSRSSERDVISTEECLAAYIPKPYHKSRGSVRRDTFRRLIFSKVPVKQFESTAVMAAYEMMYEELGVALEGTVFNSAAEVLRFLQGCRWSINMFSKRCLQHLEWRSKNLPVDSTELIANSGPGVFYVCGRDRRFRPVIIGRMRNYSSKHGEITFKTLLFWLEYLINCKLVPGKVEQLTAILDVSGVSVFSVPTFDISYITDIQANYPNRLHKLFVINMGAPLKLWWNVFVAPNINKWTKERIIILGDGYRETLKKEISRSQLEMNYGGRLPDFQFENGKLPEAYFPALDPRTHAS